MRTAERARVLRLRRRRGRAPCACRDVEAACRRARAHRGRVGEHVRRAAYNLHANPADGREVLDADDDGVLTRGTLVGRIREETRAREERGQRMLQEKYDARAPRVHRHRRCRRCGSTERAWEEPQTRSADEGATVFCAFNLAELRRDPHARVLR